MVVCARSRRGRLLAGSLEAAGSWGPAALLRSPTLRFNSNRASVARCGRHKYERLYPVMLVQPDGSTINIQYKEPRRVLTVRNHVRSAL